ncbi:MAG: hypothetical protein PHI12_06920 [Dehalococcoidales bacterium]|nr:hypothetical protein [Dehalococcoidales bacterium]
MATYQDTFNGIWILNSTIGQWVPVSSLNPVPVVYTPGAKVITQIINLVSIAAGATTTLAQCAAIDLHNSGYQTLAITVEAIYNAIATRGITVHVRTSRDNVNYDTIDWDSWIPSFTAGISIRQTKVYSVDPAYIKVLIENLDPAQTVTGVMVYSTVG